MKKKMDSKKTQKTLLKAAFGAALLFGAATMAPGQASAASLENGWTFDLSVIDADLGAYTNVDRLTVDGTGTITQDFGSDGMFNDGDTFTELSLLQTIQVWDESNNNMNLDLFDDSTGTNYKLYLYGTGLTGYVTGVSSPNPMLASFQYVFNPGVGSIGMYLDTDSDPTNGTSATVATFSLMNPSGGQSPEGFLGGAGPNGTTDLTAAFTSAYAGVWQTQFGLDFSALPSGSLALGLLNTNNRVTSYSGIANGFVANVNSSGELNVAVPEPGTMLLLGAGMLGLGIATRIRKKK